MLKISKFVFFSNFFLSIFLTSKRNVFEHKKVHAKVPFIFWNWNFCPVAKFADFLKIVILKLYLTVSNVSVFENRKKFKSLHPSTKQSISIKLGPKKISRKSGINMYCTWFSHIFVNNCREKPNKLSQNTKRIFSSDKNSRFAQCGTVGVHATANGRKSQPTPPPPTTLITNKNAVPHCYKKNNQHIITLL